MSAPVMFNRRLREDEMDRWLDFVDQNTDHGCMDRSLAMSYLLLPDTIAFFSSLEDEMIGGTAVYRDRTRLGMVLSPVAVLKKHRDSSAFHIIKTSLPFLRTAAIRDVDAIVANRPQEKGIGFPGSLLLDSWTKVFLENIGFEPIGTIESYVLEQCDTEKHEPVETMWDDEPNLEGTKQLIWAQNESTEQTSSLIWNALDLSYNRKTLRTLSVNGTTKIAASIDRFQNATLIGLLVVDPQYSVESVVNHVVSELHGIQTSNICLPLINEGLSGLVELLASRLDASLKNQSLTLLRKQL